MLKIGKAKWMVDEYIKHELEAVDINEKELMNNLTIGYQKNFEQMGITDDDEKIELLMASIVAAYLYIEKTIDDGLDGEA